MRLDSANRSFLYLTGVALALGAVVICGALGGVLEPLLLRRLSREGAVGFLNVSLLAVLPFLLITALGLARACRSLFRQISAARRLARLVGEVSIDQPRELRDLVGEAGLGGRVTLLDIPEAFSFVYRALAPRVTLSVGLLECASAAELRAVLEHERYHVSNLDPLKVMVARCLSEAFFFLPVLGLLRARYVMARELAADRRAIEVCGRTALVGALLKVIHGPDWNELELAVALSDPASLDTRLVQLEEGGEPRLTGTDARGVMVSLLGCGFLAATFLLALANLDGTAVTHHVAGAGIAGAVLLGGILCTAPFAGAGLLAYLLIALRAGRPLQTGGVCGPQRPAPGA
jgi:Zn-dependent protease with chaperone function